MKKLKQTEYDAPEISILAVEFNHVLHAVYEVVAKQ